MHSRCSFWWFFEYRLWTILSERTNKYVHAKFRQAKDNGDKDPIELLSQSVDQNPCAWLNNWEDTSPYEMRVFVAHLIVTGIFKKNSLEQYWSRYSILHTPLFSHYMSRNHFQNILWSHQVSDPHETNPQKEEANYDCLFFGKANGGHDVKIFSIQSEGQERKFSLDEGTCPFKGRVHFKCYNPKNQTVSILNFLWSVNLAQYPNFIHLLHKRKIHAWSTVRKNQKSLPSAVTQAKFKKRWDCLLL